MRALLALHFSSIAQTVCSSFTIHLPHCTFKLREKTQNWKQFAQIFCASLLQLNFAWHLKEIVETIILMSDSNAHHIVLENNQTDLQTIVGLTEKAQKRLCLIQ